MLALQNVLGNNGLQKPMMAKSCNQVEANIESQTKQAMQVMKAKKIIKILQVINIREVMKVEKVKYQEVKEIRSEVQIKRS